MSQINTLLKELERYEGVCIFATNFAEKYDSAFERRLTMHIDFKPPSNDQALKIIEKIFPEKSRDKNLSFSSLNLNGLTGGDIKNIALNAAGLATRDSSNKIKTEHVTEAVEIVRSGKLAKAKKKGDTTYID